MSLIFFTGLLLAVVWLVEQILLLPIQIVTTLHLPSWLSLAVIILAFARLAAE